MWGERAERGGKLSCFVLKLPMGEVGIPTSANAVSLPLGRERSIDRSAAEDGEGVVAT